MFNILNNYDIILKNRGVAMGKKINKNKKQNKTLSLLKRILELPFLGIFYVVDFCFKMINWAVIGVYYVFYPVFLLLKYECLGCYYTLSFLLYPFIYVFKKLGDAIFKIYQKNRTKNINLEEIAPFEEVNMNVEDEDSQEEDKEEKPRKLTFEEYLKKKYEDFYFVKKAREKEKAEMEALILSIQKNNNRSDKPVAFRYVARDDTGKKVTNIFIAMSKMEVYTFLHNENYKVIKIETSKWINMLYGPSSSYVYKLKTKDLIFWLTQLSTYLKAGIPLTDAMRILGKQMGDTSGKKRLFDSIIYNLTLGESFSSALTKQGKSFPALLISMVKTAEATGELESTLDDMANYYTEIENTRKAMISAMSYPTIVMLFSIAVVVFIMLYVIPQFQQIYASTNAQLNGFTLFIINLSTYLKANIMTITLGLVLIIVVLVILYKNIKVVRKNMQELAMKLPLFGKIIIYKEMNVFAKTFASLLNNNVFITDSMSLLSEVTNNEIYKEIMFETIDYVARGDKISTAFHKHWAVPDVAYYMIVTGESTGALGPMMDKVAEYYQTEHQTIINSLKAFIEPAMIIFLAAIVGVIVISIVLPMFGLYTQLQ
jgi:type IV pilus assembly protein PilC